ncbi:hypothetical protein YC2023_089875 [Brassica napus]
MEQPLWIVRYLSKKELNLISPMLLATNGSLDCREVFGDSLILMGEIGVNDYTTKLQELIDLGGKTFLVPGNFPLGCFPAYLTLFDTSEKEHDPFTGCIPWLNDFGEYHNEQLKTELTRLQKLYPHVSIIYADYYNSMYPFFQEPAKYDLNLAACCGVGGQYNFTIDEECGSKGVSYCQNPSECVNWDGYHLTEAAHLKMAHGLLNGPYVIRLVMP